MNIKSIFSTYMLPAIGLLILSTIFFYPQLQGKVINAHDSTEGIGMKQEVVQYQEQTGTKSLWTNSMFGGMPAYQINTSQPSNILTYVHRGLTAFGRPIGLFFLTMLCAYLSFIFLGFSPWVSFFAGAAIGLNTSNFLLYSSGHMTKIVTLAYCVPVFIGMHIAFNKNRWLGISIFGLALGLAIYCNHPQMLYYMGISLAVYGIILFIEAIKEKQLVSFAKTTAGLLVIAAIALASSAAKILPTLEYAKDTMRGDPILTISSGASSKSSETIGLDWDYATQWSNGWLDIAAGFIPGAAGEGSGAPAPSGSQTVKNLKKKGARVTDGMKLPLYWGPIQPSTGGVFYFGAVLLFLLFIQFLLGSKKLSIWLGVSLGFLILMSLGRNAAGFNHFLFDYLPLLNKFRTPNSISSVIIVIIGLGATFGLQALVTSKVDKNLLIKKIFYAGGALLAVCLFFILNGLGFFDFSGSNDAYYAQNGFNIDDLVADRKIMMRNSALRSFVFVALSGAAIWLFLKEKIKQSVLVGVLAALTIFDTSGIGRHYLASDDFIPQRKIKTAYAQRPVDKQILSLEKDRGAYRVLDQSVNTYNSARTSYWHNTIGGYHPAKLQRYEDIKNFHLAKGNQAVYNMLNTKYIITKDQKLSTNPGAMGNAWFVKEIKIVASNDEEIQALTGFDPRQTAVVHQEFNSQVSGLSPTGQGSINMSEYLPYKIKYSTSTTAEELAVFSEIWYGPNKGWKATIDGQPAELLRVDYVLRGLKIPAGSHEVVMEFSPSSHSIGTIITLIASLMLVGFIGFNIYKSMQPASTQKKTTQKKKK